MALAAKVKRWLDSHHVAYRVLNHERTETLKEAVFALGIDHRQVIQTVLLKDAGGVVLALLPLECQIDWVQLSKETHRQFKVLSSKETNKFFNDCEPGSHPPFGKIYGIPSILDKNLEKLDVVYFEAGCHTAMIQLSKDDFQFLMEGTPTRSFAILSQENPSCLSLTANNDEDCVKIDSPELRFVAPQILEMARCYLKGTPPSLMVDALQEVITKLLGFETASHTFQIPEEGPLGLYAFWQHSVQSAFLAKKISENMHANYPVDPYLSCFLGFFHNFGYLILGHLFPHEFRLLNRWMLLRPKTSIEVLEKRLLGMGQAMTIIGNGHARLGAQLLEYWAMPEPVVIATRFHHTAGYEGAYSSYVTLIQLVNQLLKAVGLGDGQIRALDQTCLEPLGLSLDFVEECVREMQGKEANHSNYIARELAN